MNDMIKGRLAVLAFLASIGFGIAAFYCPPLAIIDSSVLYFTAQLFLFAATLLGVNLNLGKWGKTEKAETKDGCD